MSEPITKLTASRAPRFMHCAESARQVDVVYEDSTEASALGRAVHRRLAEIIRGDDLTPYAESIDADEAGILVACCLKLFGPVREYFESPLAETTYQPERGPDGGAAPSPLLAATADLSKVGVSGFACLDWKTDRDFPDDRYEAQVKLTCLCAALCFPYLESFSGSIVWARHEQIDTHRWTRAQLLDFYAEIQDRAAHPRFAIGAHCAYCPRRLRCDARREWLRDACSFVSDLAIADPPGELLADTLDKIRAIEDACDVARKAIKGHVLNAGKIPTRDGKCLKIIQQERRGLNTNKALPVLTKVLDKAELARCVSISLSRAEQIVREKYGRGEKKEAVEALRVALDEAGAVVVTLTDTLREVKDSDNE